MFGINIGAYRLVVKVQLLWQSPLHQGQMGRSGKMRHAGGLRVSSSDSEKSSSINSGSSNGRAMVTMIELLMATAVVFLRFAVKFRVIVMVRIIVRLTLVTAKEAVTRIGTASVKVIAIVTEVVPVIRIGMLM